MILGVRAHDYGRHTPEKLASLLKKDGYSAVHLAPYKALELEGDFLEEANILRVREAFEEAGITVAVLGCYVECGSLDADLFEKGMTQFRQYLRAAKGLKAKCVGTETTNCLEVNREQGYAQVKRFAMEMAKEAEKNDMLVGIEPVYRHTINTPQLLKRLLDEVDHPQMRVIFDPVNLLYEGNTDTQEKLWRDAIDCFGEKVVAMHIKDGRYSNNQYTPLPLGEGVMRYHDIAQWLKKAHPNMPLLREEANSNAPKEEIAFLEKTFCR